MSRRERGFTLVEVIVAAMIVTIGLAGITAMLQLAVYGVREGRHLTAAIFLAQERAEEVRGARWDADAGDCLGVSPALALPPVTSTCSGAGVDHVPFPDEVGTLRPPFEPFTRTVRVNPCAAAETCPVVSADLRLVTVAISYVSTSGIGGNVSGRPQIITVRSLVARRL